MNVNKIPRLMTSKKRADYQREYRKQRIHRVIIFSQEEYQTLLKSARDCKKPFSTYVRQTALSLGANRYVLPDYEQTRAVQLLLVRYGTLLNQIAYVSNATFEVSPGAIQNIQTQFRKMEQQITALYNKPILVDDVIRNTVLKNPDYLRRIKTLLNEFS